MEFFIFLPSTNVMSKLFKLALLLLLFASDALAADTYCGVDTDRSGTIDFWCPFPDKDADAYYSDGTGPRVGIDCDDEDANIWPGVITGKGCTSGQFHTCQADGTYTSCAALSTFTAHSGSGHTYWISPTGSTSSAGTYAAPWRLDCFSNSGLACYHSPVPGDAFVLRGGTYSQVWSSTPQKMIAFYDKDGTALDRITLRGAPGEEAIIESPGVAPDFVIPIRIEESSYWTVTQLTIRNGYATFGVWMNGSPYGEVYNNKIYDLDGNCGGENCGAVVFDSSANYSNIHHNYFADNYNRAAPTNQNNTTGVAGFASDHVKIDDNQCVVTVAGGAGYCIKIKHGSITGGDTIDRNFSINSRWAAIGNASANMQIYNNRLVNADFGDLQEQSAIAVVDLGGVFYPTNIDIQENTIVNSWPLRFNPSTDYGAIGTPSLIFKNNVIVDDRSTAYPSTSDQGFMSICNYCNDTLYTDVVTGGKIDMNENCYSNENAVPLFFSLFGNNGSSSFGSTYTGLSAWAAGTGYDVDSFDEDPLWDIYNIAHSANCFEKGWRASGGPGVPWGILSDRLTRGRR